MAETLTLTTPEITPAVTTADYRVVYLLLDIDRSRIVVHLRGTNGELRQVSYDGSMARDLIVALNKANLTIKSLQRRILERIAADGFLVGTVTGTVDE